MARPKWVTEWERSLLSVRSNANGPVSLSDPAQSFLAGAYADMLLQIEATILRQPGELNPLRAEAAIRRVRSIMEQAGGTIGDDLKRRIDTLINAIAEDHERAVRSAFKAANVEGSLSVDFASVPRRALEGMAKRAAGEGIAGNFRSLIATQWGHTFGEVDQFLIAQVGLGAPAELAKRRLSFMLATDATGNIDPALARALKTRGVAGRRFLGIIARAIKDPEAMGFSSSSQAIAALERARGLLWKSRRIVVSEMNTAHSEAHREGAITSPVVDLFKWNTSGRHRGLSSAPDVCDTLANRDIHGLGKGVYFIETYPYRPHPNCACFQSFVLRPIDQWNQPKRTPTRPRKITPEEIFSDYGERIGEERAKNLAKRLNAQIKAADDAYRKGLPPGKPGRPARPKPNPPAPPGKKATPPVAPGIAPAVAPTAGRFAHNPLRDPDSGAWVDAARAYDLISERLKGGSTGAIRAKLEAAQDAMKQTTLRFIENAREYSATRSAQTRLEAQIFDAMDKDGLYQPNGVVFNPGAMDLIQSRYRENAEWKALADRLQKLRDEKRVLDATQNTNRNLVTVYEGEYRRTVGEQVKPLLMHEADEVSSYRIEAELFFDNGLAGELRIKSKANANQTTLDLANQGLGIWKRFFSPAVLDRLPSRVRVFGKQPDRGWQLPIRIDGVDTSVLGLNNASGTRLVIHELGHWLETHHPEYFRAVADYIRRRTAGRKVKKLKALTGRGYSSREVAYDMGGISDVDPYLWKQYTNYKGELRSSELTSMFVEALDRDVAEMMVDRDLFEFMYNLLRGNF